MISRSPRGFAPLIESEIFMDVHGVAAGVDPDPSATRSRICRMCATEVLLWGLKDWWVQERAKGGLAEHIMKRPDCLEGAQCSRQKEHGMLSLHFAARALPVTHIITFSTQLMLKNVSFCTPQSTNPA